MSKTTRFSWREAFGMRIKPTRKLRLDHSNDRVLPPEYDGDVLLWDIDKTYLDTHFSSWRGLAAIPFEFAIDKQAIPGAPVVLRALRRGPGPDSAIVPLYFVSGSPPQLRKVIEKRMTLDGVEFDGITFKDQLGLVLSGQPRLLREQIGYKLTALLLYRRAVPAAARWLMFGDDVEADAELFLLFGRICAGLRGEALRADLDARGVHRRDRENICELAATLEGTKDPITRIFIHLERGTDPRRFRDPRVVPTRSYLQTILVLYGMGRVNAAAIGAVARELRMHRLAEGEIHEHLDDAVARLGVEQEHADLALSD